MKYVALIFAAFLLFPLVTRAADEGDVLVRIFDQQGEITSTFAPFGADYKGTASIAAADLGGDGIAEIIVGAGPGREPRVHLFRQNGSEIASFLAYDESMKSGITIAACDINGDGWQEVITGTQIGGGPHVRIFNTQGGELYGNGFFAYTENFHGGVNVACADVNGDGKAEIITGAGITGGPHVRIFTPHGELQTEVFTGAADENTGITVATGDVDGDGDSEIITARMGAGESTVMILNMRENSLRFLASFTAFADYKNGLHVFATDIDGDTRDEVGVTTARHEQGIVKFFELTGATAKEFTPFDSQKERGVIGAAEKNSGALVTLATSPRTGDTVGKYIRVDISEQRLYAYENGVLSNTFLVSTGTHAFPTPLGKTEVTAKLPVHDYVWSYGPGNPNNYALRGVKYNLRFRQHYYIHSAYWHNNFGQRMSHGCVNVSLENAEWIFNWADVGTTVEIVQ